MFRRISAANCRSTGVFAFSTTALHCAPSVTKAPKFKRRVATEVVDDKVRDQIAAEVYARGAIRDLMGSHFYETNKAADDAYKATGLANSTTPTLESDPIGFFKLERQKEKMANAKSWVQKEKEGLTAAEIEDFKETAVLEAQNGKMEKLRLLLENQKFARELHGSEQQQIAAPNNGENGSSSSPTNGRSTVHPSLTDQGKEDKLRDHRRGLFAHKQAEVARKYFATKEDPEGFAKAALVKKRVDLELSGTTLNLDEEMELHEQEAARKAMDDEDGEEDVWDNGNDDSWEDKSVSSGGYFTSSAFLPVPSSSGLDKRKPKEEFTSGAIRTQPPPRRGAAAGGAPVGVFTGFGGANGGAPRGEGGGIDDVDDALSGEDDGDYTYDPELEETV